MLIFKRAGFTILQRKNNFYMKNSEYICVIIKAITACFPCFQMGVRDIVVSIVVNRR